MSCKNMNSNVEMKLHGKSVEGKESQILDRNDAKSEMYVIQKIVSHGLAERRNVLNRMR